MQKNRRIFLMGRLKSREWTSWHGQKCRGGHRGSGQRGSGHCGSMCAQKSLSYTLSRPMCCSYFWQMRHKTKALL